MAGRQGKESSDQHHRIATAGSDWPGMRRETSDHIRKSMRLSWRPERTTASQQVSEKWVSMETTPEYATKTDASTVFLSGCELPSHLTNLCSCVPVAMEVAKEVEGFLP